MMMFYFYLVCFTFSISYLVLPFHLVQFFNFSVLLLFFFTALSSREEKFCVCMYVVVIQSHSGV